MKKKVLLVLSLIVVLLLVGYRISISHSVKEEVIEEKKEEIIDIKLANLSKGEVVEGASIKQELLLEDNKIKDGIININNPGDYVVYTFDVINNGNTNMKIKSIKHTDIYCLNEDICKNISMDLSYSDLPNELVKENDVIKSNTTLNITLTVIYNNGKDVLENVNADISNIGLEIQFDKIN